MIKLGETVDRKREVNFFLADAVNPLSGIAGHAWALGEIKITLPGGVEGNADQTLVVDKLNGAYALRLTNAQCLLAGTVLVRYVVAGAQANTVQETIYDPLDFGIPASSGGGGGGTLLPPGPVTLAVLIDIVRTRGDYLSSLTFLDSYITHEIQAAWNELYEIVADVNEGWWMSQGTVVCVPAQAYIGLPSDHWRLSGVDVAVGTEWRELRQIAIGDRNRITTAPGELRSYRLSARGLELLPPPAVAETLRITYTPQCPVLDNTGIQLYGWEEYVITGALLRIDQREEKPLGEREQELERQRARVIKAASHRKSAEPEYLVHHGEGGDFDGYGGW